MSYIVEQKIKGRIYLYEVHSYWDKEKKQSRQKRKYIGPKDGKKKTSIKSIDSNIVYKNYGSIYLLNHISEKLGLTSLLKEVYPNEYRNLLGLAYYEITASNALYLFPYWLEEQYLPGTHKMDSSAISKFCDQLGRNQEQMLNFQQRWVEHLEPVEVLLYDITFISSYSTNIDYIQWGYNRDNEKLAQLNMGVVFCNEKSLPIFYTLYPGSIVDVKTLKNCMSYLKVLGLSKFTFVLDRGFFSTANVTQMNKQQGSIGFIQPLPFSLKKVRELIGVNKTRLRGMDNVFSFNDELLFHLKSEIELDGQNYSAHIFLNEKAQLDQRQVLMKNILDIECKIIKNKKFVSLKEALTFKENNLPKAYQPYFKWHRLSKQFNRNTKSIQAKLSHAGYFVLSTNKQDLKKEQILTNYRNKDRVEKVFDLLKNEMDGNRLRAHSQYNTEARLFIKFLALVIQSEIIKTMRGANLFKKYTVRELLAELKNIKLAQINGQTIITEVSKKQRLILQAFDIQKQHIHRY